MVKKLFKSLSMGVIVFGIAILVGYLAYVITYRYQVQNLQETMGNRGLVDATPVYQDSQPIEADQITVVDYYLARFENDDITIYMVYNNEESFLYTLDVYAGNLPAEDMLKLKEGVVLKNRQELASFEEDYTS